MSCLELALECWLTGDMGDGEIGPLGALLSTGDGGAGPPTGVLTFPERQLS